MLPWGEGKVAAYVLLFCVLYATDAATLWDETWSPAVPFGWLATGLATGWLAGSRRYALPTWLSRARTGNLALARRHLAPVPLPSLSLPGSLARRGGGNHQISSSQSRRQAGLVQGENQTLSAQRWLASGSLRWFNFLNSYNCLDRTLIYLGIHPISLM